MEAADRTFLESQILPVLRWSVRESSATRILYAVCKTFLLPVASSQLNAGLLPPMPTGFERYSQRRLTTAKFCAFTTKLLNKTRQADIVCFTINLYFYHPA